MLTFDFPRDGDIHTLADFTEILCLLTPDRMCSRDSLADYVRDNNPDKVISDDQLEDTFEQLRWRTLAFGERYPFTLIEHGRVLSGVPQTSDSQNLYVFLLLCANLPFLERGATKPLTDAFEKLSLAAIRKLWPTNAVVRAFGKNETEYKGEKWQRLNALSKDLGGSASLTKEDFRKNDSGDGGVDLVAWLQLDKHEGSHIPSALAQCACSRSQWVKKQSEITHQRLGNHLRPSYPWMEMIFIPLSFRDNRGSWAVKADVTAIIVMDRLRILNHVDEEDINTFEQPNVLHRFLEARLELV